MSHCEEATQLLTKQIVMDKVSDTIMRDNIDQMEKELDGVEKIEDTLEGMIGRLTTARELLELEISKINASGHLFSQLSRDLPNDGAVQAKEKSSRKVQEGIDVKEMLILQTLVGIRNPDDIQKILEKSYKLEQGLYETGLESVRSTMEETYSLPLQRVNYQGKVSWNRWWRPCMRIVRLMISSTLTLISLLKSGHLSRGWMRLNAG